MERKKRFADAGQIMKISIDGEMDIDKGGRQGFLSMMAESLCSHHGFRIVGKKDKSDIHLNSISGNTKNGSVNVLRIDGIYYDSERLAKNKSIVKSAKAHDHVIFQSNFSKVNFEKITGANVKSTVIFNGAKRLASINNGKNLLIGCSAKWRVNKRLEGILEAIRIARISTGQDIKLKVIGQPDVNLPSYCIYTGQISNTLVQKELSECCAFIHICHIESCPNSVIEALLVGLPVLTNNIGGTQEIVGSDGIVSKIDHWDFKPIKNMDSTKLNRNQTELLAHDVASIIKFDKNVIRDDLLIRNISSKYAALFKEIVK